MDRYRRFAVAWLFGTALGWTGTLFAAETVVGSVLAVRGAVFAESSAGTQPLGANAPLHRGDTIVANAGKAKIALNDGSIISIGENTRLRLADYERSSGSVRAKIQLISGALRVFVAKVTPAGRFEVETETAIAAVRGTDWLIEATSDRTGVAVLRGIVAVAGRAASPPATVVLRSPGQGTDVRAGSAPTPPAPWGMTRLANLLARTAFD